MKRSGRKSAAQTPAPPSERIRGSKTNPKGSAASTESANKIKLSEDILKTLKNKADAYNEKHPKNKVSVSTLKAVFRRGAGAYSSSHRPTITGGRPNSRTAWAYARVNKFLLKKGGTKVKAAYVQDDDLMERGGLIEALTTRIENLNKNGIVLKDKGDTITLIAYNTGNQPRESSLYNKALIYSSVKPIKSANEIIQKFDLQDFENFREDKIEEYKKNHLVVINQNKVVYDSENLNIRYEDGGEMQQNIALPDTYSTFDKLKPILANQGYELNRITDNNFAKGGLLKPTMTVAQIAKKHGKKESYIENQLEIGTKHELEHSYSEELAKKTALHHLAEMADYYTRLKKMELQQEAEKLTDYYAQGGVTDYGTCEVLDEDGERKIDEKSIQQLTECVMNLPQTKSFHIDFETSQYKPYRKRLHKDIIYQIKKDLVCVEREEPIAILLGGSPASGKSTFLKKYAPYLLSDEILKIDADEIRAKLPEYRGYNAAQTHLETKDIVTTLLSDRNIGIPCTFDVIYDGTMNNTKSYAPLIQLLKSLGYKVFIIYIDKVPKNVAIERALKRYQNSGRFVPVEVIEDFFTKGKTALNELKSSVDGYMIVDGSDKNYHVIERGGMKIPQDRTYSNIGSPIKITTEEVVREFAKGGQVGMQGNIKHSSGAAGGYLVGKRHSEGGIKAINKSTNQPLEMEGGEVVITRDAVSDSEKREFEGEMLTNREILSRINQSGGGVSFEKGGQTDYKCACNGKKYAYGGKVLSDYEIVNQINRLYPNSIMTYSEYKNQINQEGTTKQYFDHLENMGVDISSITFIERAKLLTY